MSGTRRSAGEQAASRRSVGSQAGGGLTAPGPLLPHDVLQANGRPHDVPQAHEQVAASRHRGRSTGERTLVWRRSGEGLAYVRLPLAATRRDDEGGLGVL